MGRLSGNKPRFQEKSASEQIHAFATCGNFPKDRHGLEALSTALQAAAQSTGISMAAIIEECSGSSAWCPTPYDLRQVAMGMKQRIVDARGDNQRAAWRRIYGEPNPAFASDLLAQIAGPHPKSQKTLHRRAIREMLYYTEGDGLLFGDRDFWVAARAHDLRDWPALVDEIRAAGGWKTERELQCA